MKHFVGIDLGTTNSAICSYDGSETRIWKSPEQNDVTPSAIYIDRRGNKYFGRWAYDSAPQSPDNAAMLFKRLMGTTTPIHFSAVGLTKTPEECSAEVLRVLFGYLPEEIRNDAETRTVITVPAAFNLMQKDATMQAAKMAGIGQVGLMQEPVAAVMSVMRVRKTDGMFLIFDLGGGTLDIAIAESIGGRVSLLTHGGIAMLGGRDFDRTIFKRIVQPWLLQNFDLPNNFSTNTKFKRLIRLSTWAVERAKIRLSSNQDSIISLTEVEARFQDKSGKEIYLDIPIERDTFNSLIATQVEESVEAVRATISEAGLTPRDLDSIVFIGGPTNYKPLRDKVVSELGVPGSIDVNPMTAVAEGASVFAESIDWSSQRRQRKSSREQMSADGDLSLAFNYIARTPEAKGKIIVQLTGQTLSGWEIQIDSIDTGWTSGRRLLEHNATIDVTLTKIGENFFKVFVFDSAGGPVTLENDRIVITRTAAVVDAIPASHSIGIEVLEKLGGTPGFDYLIRKGDPLPKKGERGFKAAESLKAGATGSLNFKLWEGEIEDPITDNRPIGALKISGSDFDDGVIPAGADLECDYEIQDSGLIILEVSVPCIGSTFHSDRNFYSWQQEDGTDITSTSTALIVVEKGQETLNRISELEEAVEDPRLDGARQKLEYSVTLNTETVDPDSTQEAIKNVDEARKLLAQVRKDHRKEIQQIELDDVTSRFDKYARQHARPSEISAFDNLKKTAQRAIDAHRRDSENFLGELRNKHFAILWRQDWFIIDLFKNLINSPHMFPDKQQFEELARLGIQLMRSDEIDKLREVVAQLYLIRIGGNPEDDMFDVVNIIRG